MSSSVARKSLRLIFPKGKSCLDAMNVKKKKKKLIKTFFCLLIQLTPRIRDFGVIQVFSVIHYFQA